MTDAPSTDRPRLPLEAALEPPFDLGIVRGAEELTLTVAKSGRTPGDA